MLFAVVSVVRGRGEEEGSTAEKKMQPRDQRKIQPANKLAWGYSLAG